MISRYSVTLTKRKIWQRQLQDATVATSMLVPISSEENINFPDTCTVLVLKGTAVKTHSKFYLSVRAFHSERGGRKVCVAFVFVVVDGLMMMLIIMMLLLFLLSYLGFILISNFL